MLAVQRSLFGGGEPCLGADLAAARRIALDEDAWVDHLPGWIGGQQALMDHLVATTRFRHERREMYDRLVEVPRLVAVLPDDGPGHPVLEAIGRALGARYDTAFPRVSLGLYRHGRDSVAWHGDQVARNLPQAVVATVSLGAPRRFLLRRAEGGAGGPSLAFSLGWGDLLVMGGACQRTWRHAVPKTASDSGSRLAVMFRPDWSRPPRDQRPEFPDKP
jgi:alkylated DNA repair dioxygenase AlkB